MFQPITKMDNLRKGSLYIRMHLSTRVNSSMLWHFMPTSKPYKHQCASLGSLWYIDGKISFIGGSFEDSGCVIKDANIIPNNYNNSSLWEHSTQTLKFLQDVQADISDSRQQYLEILTRLKRGYTYAITN